MGSDQGPAYPKKSLQLRRLMEEVRALRSLVAAFEAHRAMIERENQIRDSFFSKGNPQHKAPSPTHHHRQRTTTIG